MINIISAVGSIGTFIMACFYLISVSIQLYQMRISFVPALGFNQILLQRDDGRLKRYNISTNGEESNRYLKLYNLGGGSAKEVIITIKHMAENKVLQKKYVSILPSKEWYLVPINDEVFHELSETIKQNGYEADLKVELEYKHNLSKKYKYLELFGKIDTFNHFSENPTYELQFVQASAIKHDD
ncbi:hypothetical protein [Staphylococcus debuckii]|uniref:Uncharacterized protein n=1 Tax=Staphylococcus debuckii TaxID=2044912 RepID=A0ABU9F0I2_9STAP